MSFTISVTRKHITDHTNNNKFLYPFRTSVKLDNHEAKLSSIVAFNSTFNVKEGVNNKLQYRWFDGQIYTCELPSGFYSIENIQSYFYQKMYERGHYLLTNEERVLIYLEFIVNSTYYATQLNAFKYPTSQEIIDNEYTVPEGGFNPPADFTGETAQIIIPDDNEFGLLLGFTPGTYPPNIENSTYSINSQISPQISPVSAYNVCTSLADNLYTQRSDLIQTYLPTESYGSPYYIQFQNAEYIPIPSGTYSNFSVQILDQNYNDIKFEDPELVISFLIREKQKLTFEDNVKNLPAGFQRL